MSQIADLIRRAARRFGDKPCLVEGERVVSFADFDAATNRLANALLALGLDHGDRVGVLLPNGIDCLVAYYGLAKAGLVRVSLNSRDTPADLAFKLAEVGARAVLVGEDAPELGVERVLTAAEVERLLSAASDAPPQVRRSLDEPYRLGFTGGTTGRPKAVTLTERGELAELSAFLTDLVPDIGPDDRFLHAAPIAHASGAFFLPALVRGTTSLVMAKFDPAAFVALAAETRATMTFLVPTMLALLLEEPALAGADLALRRIAYGASPIAPALYARAEARFGKVFAQTYGQAESPMVITCLGPDEHDRVGSCGRAFTLAEVAVMDDDGALLPPGAVGEIVVRGPQLMARYWNRRHRGGGDRPSGRDLGRPGPCGRRRAGDRHSRAAGPRPRRAGGLQGAQVRRGVGQPPQEPGQQDPAPRGQAPGARGAGGAGMRNPGPAWHVALHGLAILRTATAASMTPGKASSTSSTSRG